MTRSVLNLLIISALALHSFAAGPFGFEKGMKRADVIRLWGKNSLPARGRVDTVYLTTAPDPDPLFTSYVLVFSPKDGLVKVTAVGKVMDVDPEGAEMKQAYNHVLDKLMGIYGEPGEYMRLWAGWSFDELGDHPIGHVIAICLGVTKLGKEKGGTISVQFDFEGYMEYKYRNPALAHSYCE